MLLTLLAMGIVFEMPVVMLILARLRIMSSALMRRHWRISIVVLAVVAMLLPGVDPISFIVEFIPLLVLYGLSYFIVRAVEKARGDSLILSPADMILGADWVLPVDGPPLRDGAVRIEDGAIAEVSASLTPDERFADAVILPGLVNAHTHLEYHSMSAMGDGLPFTPWIEQLIVRKRGLDRDDYLAQAAAAVHACLAGGVTTIADCSYADTVAEAAIEQGLRAIVYLEAFSDQGDPAGLMPARLDALPADAADHPRHLAPRSLHRHRRALRRPDRAGTLSAASRSPPICSSPSETPSRSNGWPACWGRTPSPCTLCARRPDDIALLAAAGRAGGALPALERAARLRHGAAAGAARGGASRRPGHRLAGIRAGLRHVGRDAGGDPARPRPRRPPRRADGRTRRCGWQRWAAPPRSAWATGSDR